MNGKYLLKNGGFLRLNYTNERIAKSRESRPSERSLEHTLHSNSGAK